MANQQEPGQKKQGSNGNATQSNISWLGFNRNNLSDQWKNAVNKFLGAGGGAEQRLGTLSMATIHSRNGNPVHKSSFNRRDKNDVISVRVRGANDTKTCHIYADGKGTTRRGERRR